MEFVFGENLSEYRKRQPEKRLTPEETCARGVESCLALAYAHGQGIVHHDIKPHNVMLTRSGRVKLCDFGLARMAGMTWSGGAHAGTPAFISPERVRGDEGDARSDLYSLAATLYLLGNGRTLFGSKVEQAVQGHLSQSVPASPHLPPAVHAVLEKALQKNPKDRYANAREMGEALMEAAQAGRRKETPTSAGSAEAARTTPAAGPAPTSSPASREPAPAAPPRTSLAPDRAARMSLRAGAPRLRVPEDMVIVEACEVGSAYGGSYPVPKFAMERTPVTNEQYFAFVKATGARSPDHWRKGAPPRDRLKHPVVGITLAEARLYAEHLGRRLPTCLEWEAAARSPDGRAFPWGDEFDPSRCNGPERSGGDTVAVDRYAQGASPVGCVDMVGNVWEWTEPDPRVAAPDTADGVWVLGGSYCHPCAKNDAIARTAVSEAKSYLYLGFRCALSEEKDVI